MSFGAPENTKNALFHVFGHVSRLPNSVDMHFHRKLKSSKKPIRMVIEGLTFQFLAYGTLTRAQNTVFAKDRLISHFTNKMCIFSVQNDNIRSEQMSVFVNVFRYDTQILHCL